MDGWMDRFIWEGERERENGYTINLSYYKHKILFIMYLYSTQQQQPSRELSNEPKEETVPSDSTHQGNVRQ